MGRQIIRAGRRAIAGAAVTGGLACLLGQRVSAQAGQDGPPPQPTPLASSIEEIIVTASRRATGVTELPYNISAISGAELAADGVTNLAQLASEVPGFDLEDRGAKYAGASIPIIRGLNASSPDRGGLVTEQLPVGIYIGNSPTTGYFPLDDIQRVEVLRGPQGTLYGAGSLGGAVREIPNDPKLESWSGQIGGSVENTAHSSDPGYSGSFLLNAPIGSIAALRMSGKYDYEAGFIDQYGILERSGGPLTGVPVLANPGDVAGSSGIYYNEKDENYTLVKSGRASVLVEPNSGLKVVAAFNVSQVSGVGSPVDNPGFKGGPNPYNPTVTLPPTGPYQLDSPALTPYTRESHLASLDASYEMGFATLSSTSSYYDTAGSSFDDDTFGLLLIPAAYLAYYTGTPVNPRFLNLFAYTDTNHTFTQELRLVSSPSKTIDYVGGMFYENQGINESLDLYEPGTTAQSIAGGGPVVPTDALGRTYVSSIRQAFEDRSLFGEVTWHILPRWDFTAGARQFWQTFNENQNFDAILFGLTAQPSAANSVADHIFKLNTSYEFIDNHRIYSTFSQGFRRGGANAFATEGFLREPQAIEQYTPDKTNNYEIGVKGRSVNGIQYSADVFYVNWRNPQIGLSTPANGWPVVVNAIAARTKGIESEIHTPVLVPNVTLSAGYAYVIAELTKSFCLPSGNQTLTSFDPCGINGQAGQTLPGTPKSSGTVAMTYDEKINETKHIAYTVNGDFKSAIVQNFGITTGDEVIARDPGYWFLNANVTYSMERWRIGAYGTNLLDRRAIFSSPTRYSPEIGNITNQYTISRPREIGLRAQYSF